MKNLGIPFLIATSLILLTLVIFTSLNISFAWVYSLTIIGQLLLVFTVYKVLTDNYTTDKTFEDFYEDHPIGRDQHHS